MQKAICLLPVIPMRKEPSHRSEMVSQILFGEYATIVEEKDDFLKVTCSYDNYEGWVQANQLFLVGEEEALTTTHYTNGFASLVAMKNSHL
ncbi:MAG: SH3 domain-containing protein, partial [Chitinophagaceae bacterium]